MGEADTFPLHDRLKARLSLVRADLDEVMSRLKDEDLAFAPREGMRTIGGQLAEIAGTEIQLLSLLRDNKHLDWEETNKSLERLNSVAEMKEVLAETRGVTLD